jgi:hypothetical protein
MEMTEDEYQKWQAELEALNAEIAAADAARLRLAEREEAHLAAALRRRPYGARQGLTVLFYCVECGKPSSCMHSAGETVAQRLGMAAGLMRQLEDRACARCESKRWDKPQPT